MPWEEFHIFLFVEFVILYLHPALVTGSLTMSPPKEKFISVLDFAFANIPTVLCESAQPMKGRLPGSKVLEEEDIEGSLASSRTSRMSSRWDTGRDRGISSGSHHCNWWWCLFEHVICQMSLLRLVTSVTWWHLVTWVQHCLWFLFLVCLSVYICW